ncbi:MAG: hypothetical protein R3E77_04155 [Steroidobacteraceae bacterium]
MKKTAGASDTLVVYVHGLWLNGSESLILRQRLARLTGWPSVSFRYRSVTQPLAQIVAALGQFVASQSARTVHLIGHSLGGLVIYRLLEAEEPAQPGAVVWLGTPAVKSGTALQLGSRRWAAPLLGSAVAEELLAPRQRHWRSGRALGIIAGTHAVGLGRLFSRIEEPSDGTVAVSETRLPGATDHLTLPVSHTGMLLSARVAEQTAAFLREGHFSLRP